MRWGLRTACRRCSPPHCGRPDHGARRAPHPPRSRAAIGRISATSSGKRSLISRPLRNSRRTTSPCLPRRQRKPSYFSSWIQPGARTAARRCEHEVDGRSHAGVVRWDMAKGADYMRRSTLGTNEVDYKGVTIGVALGGLRCLTQHGHVPSRAHRPAAEMILSDSLLRSSLLRRSPRSPETTRDGRAS